MRDAISKLDSIVANSPLSGLLTQGEPAVNMSSGGQLATVPDFAPMCQETRRRFEALLADVLAHREEPVVTLYDVLLFSCQQGSCPEVISSLVLNNGPPLQSGLPPCSTRRPESANTSESNDSAEPPWTPKKD